QIKFATCTLFDSALTWWNSHVKTVGPDVAYKITNLKKKTTDKYCPRGEIKKLEIELWNLKVKGTDVVSYNQRFQELALIYARIFPEESDKIERYISGLPNMIYRSVMESKPKTMQDAVEFATELMDKKSVLLLNVRLRIKGSKMIINTKKTIGRTLVGPSLLGMGRRSHIGDLSHCALNATITMMVRVLPNATSAKELAIWPVTVGILLLLTIRETSLAMNVGIKGTT
nr:reverse transcriptase domain-containing protein [Tanacetum cinerariifolium]